MKLDWNNFELGYIEELEKSAAVPRGGVVRRPHIPSAPAPPTPGKNTVRNIAGVGLGGTALGAGATYLPGAYDTITGMYDNAEKAVSGLGGLLPLGLQALMGGGKKRSQGEGGLNLNLADLLGQKKNILNYDAMDPRSLTSPALGYGAPKVAEAITGIVAKSLQQRALNSVIDRVLKKEESPEAGQPKEHEIALESKHPQLQELLKDEKNKAYLEKLLHA